MLIKRPRRNRKTAAIRSLVEETVLHVSDLVSPFFLLPGENRSEDIPSMPGIQRLSIDLILKQAEQLHCQGIPAIALFPVIPHEEKDPVGSAALNPQGVVPSALEMLKKEIPSLCVIADIALDPFTSHGHDGLVNGDNHILNDPTVELLAEIALLYA